MNKPVYLLALNGNQRMKAKIHSNKYVSEAEAHELALKIKALHYFEITNAIQHLPLLVLALGRFVYFSFDLFDYSLMIYLKILSEKANF